MERLFGTPELVSVELFKVKNTLKHGKSHGKSWNLKSVKEYELLFIPFVTVDYRPKNETCKRKSSQCKNHRDEHCYDLVLNYILTRGHKFVNFCMVVFGNSLFHLNNKPEFMNIFK